MRILLAALTVAPGLLAVAGCKDATRTLATGGTASVEVTAGQLWAAYHANEVTADDRYRNRHVVVTGTVREIKKDVADNPYVVLSAGDSNEVWAYLSNLSDARSLRRGSTIRAACIGNNVVLDSPVLADCSIVSPEKVAEPSEKAPEASSPKQPESNSPSYIGKSLGEMNSKELREMFRSPDQSDKCLAAITIAQNYHDANNAKEAHRWKETARKLGCDQLPLGYSQLEF